MREAALKHLGGASVVIKAAAVADYRVELTGPTKIKTGGKREGLRLDLVPNPDILKELAQKKGGAFLVGFAAETNDVRAHAAEKLRAKGVDLLVANDVSQHGIGFEADDNQVVLLARWGGPLELPLLTNFHPPPALPPLPLAPRASPQS